MSYTPSHIPGSGKPPSHERDWVLQVASLLIGVGAIAWAIYMMEKLQ